MQTYMIAYYLVLTAVTAVVLFTKTKQGSRYLWLGYAVPILGIAVLLLLSFKFNFTDFLQAYYPAGKLILQAPTKLYIPVERGISVSGFVNIPIVALLFTPFSFLTPSNANRLFSVLTVLALILTIYLTIKSTQASGVKGIVILSLFATNGPFWYSFQLGNTTHLIALLILVAFLCLQSQRNLTGGSLLAIGALIKIPLLLFVVYFLARRRWSVLLGFTATLMLLVTLSIGLFGWDLHILWFKECIQPFSGKPLGAFNVQSLDAFLVRLLSNQDILYNWQPITVGWPFKILRYALVSLIVGSVILCCFRPASKSPQATENLEFSIVLCLMLIVSPLTWTHYYLFLLLPLSLYFGGRLAVPQGKWWQACIICSTSLVSSPVMLHNPEFHVFEPLKQKLLVSTYFLGVILLLGILLRARWIIAKNSSSNLTTHSL